MLNRTTCIAILALTLGLLSCGDDASPQMVSCESTDDCPSGDTCYIYGGFCTAGCNGSSDCPAKEECHWTVEFDFQESSGWSGPGFCDPDCIGNESVCTGGTMCDTSSSLCIPRCGGDGDCGDGKKCASSGKCVSCMDDGDCPSTYTCSSSGNCQAPAPPCKKFCSCSCSCGSATISSNQCLNCTSECSSTCNDMCGGWW